MTAVLPPDPMHPLASMDRGFLPPHLKAIVHVLDFLKWRFSLLPVGAYRWNPETEDSPDQAESEIFIGADTPIRVVQVGKRPAITVLRSTLAFQGVGIGDLAFHDMRTGGKAYMDLLPTTLCINVLSRMPEVAERLAWHVTEQLWTLREELIKTEPCILLTGTKPVLGPPSPAGAFVDTEKPDWSVVTVTLPLYLQHTTSKMPLNRPIWNRTKWNLRIR